MALNNGIVTWQGLMSVKIKQNPHRGQVKIKVKKIHSFLFIPVTLMCMSRVSK